MITERIQKIQEILRSKKEPTAFIITSEQNRRYMTGITTSSGYVIITPENKYFFTDSRYIEYATKSLGKDYTVILSPKNYEAKTYYSEILGKESVKDILYEENYIYLKTKKNFDELFEDFNLLESENLLENMRKVKDCAEIEDIKRAQNITDKAFTHILKVISSGINTITEKDIAVEIEFFIKKNGADNIAFDVISVSGKKSSYPHGVPENIKLSKGFLLMDFGATFNGYCSDMTRTVCIGKPDEKMREVYNIVRNAQETAIDMLKSGIEAVEVDRAARDIIKNAGYGNNFGHSLGHSLGLEIHEKPSFPMSGNNENITAKIILTENTVITVEPGIYIEDEFGVRTEDLIVIKKDGVENLTLSNKDLIEI